MKKRCCFLVKFLLITSVCADFRGPVPIQDDVDLMYSSQTKLLWVPVHPILAFNGTGTNLAVFTMAVMIALARILVYLFPASKRDEDQMKICEISKLTDKIKLFESHYFKGPVPIEDGVISYHDVMYSSQMKLPVHPILAFNGTGTNLAVFTMAVMIALALILTYLFPASKTDQDQTKETVKLTKSSNSNPDRRNTLHPLQRDLKKVLFLLHTIFAAGVTGMLLIMAGDVEQNPGPQTRQVLPSPGICDLANIQVTDWYSVGLQLGLSESTLASIQSDDTHDPNNPQTYATAMFSLFLQSCTYPSYLKVMKALISAGENKAAKKLSKQCGIQLPLPEEGLPIGNRVQWECSKVEDPIHHPLSESSSKKLQEARPQSSPKSLLDGTVLYPLDVTNQGELTPQVARLSHPVVVREKKAGVPYNIMELRSSDVSRGDHILMPISQKPFSPIYHSALVCDVKGQQIQVIQNKLGGVKKEWILPRKLYLVEYTTCRFSQEEAVSRAERRVREEKYHPLQHSSHHFVTWAKTGKEYCLDDILERIEVLTDDCEEDAEPMTVHSTSKQTVSDQEVEMKLFVETGVEVQLKEFDAIKPDTVESDTIKSPSSLPGKPVPDIASSEPVPPQASIVEEIEEQYHMEDLKPVLTKSAMIVALKKELTRGDHIMAISECNSTQHILLDSINNHEEWKFSGYTCARTLRGKQIIVKKEFKCRRIYRIDYEHRNLKSAQQAVQDAQTETGKSWDGGDDEFVIKMKTGTKHSINIECLFTEPKEPIGCTKVSTTSAIEIGQHLLVKHDGAFHSVLVYDCTGNDILRFLPTIGKKDYFRLTEQNEVFRVNYPQSLPPLEVIKRVNSQEGSEVLSECRDHPERFISWAKVGRRMTLDIPELMKRELKLQTRPEEYEKLHTVDEIRVGDHLIRNDRSHWFHFLVTKSNPKHPRRFMAIYCLRTKVLETEITINPGSQKIYRIIYPESFPADKAVKRARNHLGKRHCHPYARMWFIPWAKTGLEGGIEVSFLHSTILPCKSQICSMSQLEPGDYFVVKPENGRYWHHHLLTEVHSPTEFTSIRSSYWQIFEERQYLADSSTCYHIRYNDGVCIAPAAVIHKARRLCCVRPCLFSRQKFVHYVKTGEEVAISVDNLPDDRYDPQLEEVKSAKVLMRGDHIVRPVSGSSILRLKDPLQHHMIVTERSAHDRECKVLNFSTNKWWFKLWNKGGVKEETVDLFKHGKVSRVLYADRIHPEDGIRHIQQHHMQDRYYFYSQNCEHLVMAGTVGEWRSIQVSKVQKRSKVLLKAIAIGAVKASTLKGVPKGITKAGDLLSGGGKAAISTLTRISAVGASHTMGLALVTSAPLDFGILGWNISKLYRKRQFELITEAHFKREVVKEHCVAINSTVFGVGGALVGSCIAPIIGTAVGAAAGSAIGEVVGRVECLVTFRIADRYFPERQVDMPPIVVYSYIDC